MPGSQTDSKAQIEQLSAQELLDRRRAQNKLAQRRFREKMRQARKQQQQQEQDGLDEAPPPFVGTSAGALAAGAPGFSTAPAMSTPMAAFSYPAATYPAISPDLAHAQAQAAMSASSADLQAAEDMISTMAPSSNVAAAAPSPVGAFSQPSGLQGADPLAFLNNGWLAASKPFLSPNSASALANTSPPEFTSPCSGSNSSGSTDGLTPEWASFLSSLPTPNGTMPSPLGVVGTSAEAGGFPTASISPQSGGFLSELMDDALSGLTEQDGPSLEEAHDLSSEVSLQSQLQQLHKDFKAKAKSQKQTQKRKKVNPCDLSVLVPRRGGMTQVETFEELRRRMAPPWPGTFNISQMSFLRAMVYIYDSVNLPAEEVFEYEAISRLYEHRPLDAPKPESADRPADKLLSQPGAGKLVFSRLPPNMRPTEDQIKIEHHPWIDTVVWPSVRDRLLRMIPLIIDEDELVSCHLIPGSTLLSRAR